MRILQKYFGTEIIRSVLFVMLALLALFSFFDLMAELPSLNKGGYSLPYALLYVLLGLPGYIYEFMPIAVLIGTIYVLAQFASNSEFTIMRAASMSTAMAAGMLFKIGILFVLLTFAFGELVAPNTSKYAESMKLTALGAAEAQEFRTGLWTKDLVRENGLSGAVIGSRFLNVQEILPNRQLNLVRMYEFDKDFHLAREVTAKRAAYQGSNVWRLFEVSETSFPKNLAAEDITGVSSHSYPSRDVISEVTPDILSVLFADPDRMSAWDLAAYTRHLAENKQDGERYEIAFWKKITYPFVTFVMMALALPFAYLHVRSGGISLKIFSGIMIGMVFYLINSLFSHLGLLNTWPAMVTALVPSILFMGLALLGLRYVERN
ncbi:MULTISPECIES: LPS export ABC transporter permease LptG [unclassified Undibacterium]|uniref:LPS export ABC transporter permease LptG n=1 Tax=unclassified Undibacterium TaxID=2630295 RepID=UPI002AC93BB4|nr:MULTISPECIES: LPS export ABC transporter permease LptG [unclassified Undibacterium]MEB0137709.1 LPS export ABC transporter permease LptG [Undibacterium sp. CCC2.1]MEB0172849.1 LPS export ABC transporter permease LptG [Undibacterium sp. CCC1.1]MEB0176677.1 LPS export ABC transporter permease LptG [Undibacterium sp. CCC3.4]MEB0215997.1 LPS export ABC transporter permease LptG [Undibacterium sp. 5I2]WPX42284.1 LPS export ABC transporter permease LptG [Undibacterium sp. CCC3.4]